MTPAPEAPEYPTTTDNPLLYEQYRWLRDEHPVYRGDDFFALSRFDDVWDAMGDWKRFSSDGVREGQSLLPLFIFMDPPRHTHLRDIVTKAFTPKRIEALQPRVRSLARHLIEDAVEAGSFDAVSSLAAPLPSTIMGELIGIPADQIATFRELAEEFIVVTPGARGMRAARSIYRFFEELLEERRRRPADDLMSALIAAEIDGQHLTHEELLGFCLLLLLAGNDTTMSLIGNGLALLGQHPHQRQALVDDPSLIPGAIEEMIRFETPTQVLPRMAREDVTLHGTIIPKGSRVLLNLGAANRDERQFVDAGSFDIRRPRGRHVGFGRGVHFCIGAPLARTEVQIVLEELLAVIPDYRIGAGARLETSNWARSHKALPIEF